MYKKISNHPHLKEIYKNKLINLHGNGIEKLTNQEAYTTTKKMWSE